MINTLQYLKDKSTKQESNKAATSDPEPTENLVKVENGTAENDEDILIIKEVQTIKDDPIINSKSDDPSSSKCNEELSSSSRPREFSSENFKLEVGNLPKYYPLGHLKKLLNNVLQLDAEKVRPGGFGRNVAHVNFKSEEAKERARLVLDGYIWQNSKLTAIVADPTKDPVLLKKIDYLKVNTKEFQDLPLADRITKAVTPYSDKSYKDQITEKDKVVKALMRKFGTEISEINPDLFDFVKWQKRRRRGQVCEMDDFVESPNQEGYLNKCEFTIGHESGKTDPIVGFRVASYKEGSVEVGPIAHLKHINDRMKTVVTCMEDFIRYSGYAVYEPFTQKGVWRQLIIRTSNNEDVMLIIVIESQELSDEDIDNIKKGIVGHFNDEGEAAVACATAIYLQRFGQKDSGPDVEYEHLWGKTYIEETILGKTFRASPDAFLQENTVACEALYSKVLEVVDVDGMTVVLDVCCGVGTIGLLAAECAHKVYGVDVTESATINARYNASNNGIANAVIFSGRAEEHIDNMIERSERFKTVAIINPPSAGLHGTVMNAMRKCEYLDTLVYISSDPLASMGNFLSLCRPRSKTYKGTFFVPIRAIPVDLLPGTSHFELVIVFERYDECKWNRILDGNPRPKDQSYFDRIPKLTYNPDEDEEKKWNRRRDDNAPFNTDRDIWGNLREGADGDEFEEYYDDDDHQPEPFCPPPPRFRGGWRPPFRGGRGGGGSTMMNYYDPPRRGGQPPFGDFGGRRPPPLMDIPIDIERRRFRENLEDRAFVEDREEAPSNDPARFGAGFDEGFKAGLDALRAAALAPQDPDFGHGGGWNTANNTQEYRAFPPPGGNRGGYTRRERPPGSSGPGGGEASFEDWTSDEFPPKRQRTLLGDYTRF